MKATLITTALAAAAAALLSFNAQAADNASSWYRESAAPSFIADGSGKTREQVRAELAEAVARGEVSNGGVRPSFTYPSHSESAPGPLATAGGKTRAQVKAELAEAIARGEVFAGGGNAYRRAPYDSAPPAFIAPADRADAMARR